MKKVEKMGNWLLTNQNRRDTIALLRNLNREVVKRMPEMDYSKLRGRIAECGMTQKHLAEKIGVSEGQLCQKMSARFTFKQKEILDICSVLGIDVGQISAFFFCPRVEKTQQRKEVKG